MPRRCHLIRICTFLLFLLGFAFFPRTVHGQGGFELQTNEVQATFPEEIVFSLEALVPGPIASVELRYGVERVACSETVSRVMPELDEEAQQPGQILVQWTWELRRSGSVPPQARIWWQWHLATEDGESWTSPMAWFTVEDDRYTWKSEMQGDITVYWYHGSREFGRAMLQVAVEAQARLTADPGAGLEQPVHIFFYADPEALKGAMLFAQDWTGGVAFPDYYTILIAAGPENQEWGASTVAHELMHLVVRQLSFNCAAGLPRWLDEGLAVWAEGGMDEYQQELLEQAIAEDSLLSLRAINSSFSAHAQRASLAYAQGYSVVNFLLERYGRERMLELLAVFRQGATYDGALQQVYGLDLDGVENLWRAEIGAAPRPTSAAPASPSPVPTRALWGQATAVPTVTASPSTTAEDTPAPPTETPAITAAAAAAGPTASPAATAAAAATAEATATGQPLARPTPIGGFVEAGSGAGWLWYLAGGGAAGIVLVIAVAVICLRRR